MLRYEGSSSNFILLSRSARPLGRRTLGTWLAPAATEVALW